MPYQLSLQSYLPPGVFEQPPEAWERQLREISPITERLAHLRFRYFVPRDAWEHPCFREPHARGVWGLYSCTPRHLVSKERAAQFEKHWSELLSAEDQKQNRDTGEAVARRSVVSSYQHYMWHVHNVEAMPFWFLHGDGGGSPAKYTRIEERALDAIGAPSEPFPIGFFPPCPFDGRALKAIAARDRFFQVSKRIEALEALDRPEHLRAEDELAEKEFRKKWLAWWFEQTAPQADFMKHFLRKSESDMTLADAPEGLNDALSQWKDHYIEHGSVIGAGAAASKRIQVAVS